MRVVEDGRRRQGEIVCMMSPECYRVNLNESNRIGKQEAHRPA